METEFTGLILTGGNSSRMGENKSLINYHNQPQYSYLHQLLKPFCKEIFVSCKQGQEHFYKDILTITDLKQYSENGPISGILTAFENAKAPFLIVACDYPLFNEELILFLLHNRNSNKIATVFKNPEDGLPEPLIGIYETTCAEKLLQHFSSGNTSMRKFLIENHAELLNTPDPDSLKSIDTSEQKEKVILQLKNQMKR